MVVVNRCKQSASGNSQWISSPSLLTIVAYHTYRRRGAADIRGGRERQHLSYRATWFEGGMRDEANKQLTRITWRCIVCTTRWFRAVPEPNLICPISQQSSNIAHCSVNIDEIFWSLVFAWALAVSCRWLTIVFSLNIVVSRYIYYFLCGMQCILYMNTVCFHVVSMHAESTEIPEHLKMVSFNAVVDVVAQQSSSFVSVWVLCCVMHDNGDCWPRKICKSTNAFSGDVRDLTAPSRKIYATEMGNRLRLLRW